MATMARRDWSDKSGTAELVIITGLSGSGKGSVLKGLEDLGYYAVDNLPIDLIPKVRGTDPGFRYRRLPPWWLTSVKGKD